MKIVIGAGGTGGHIFPAIAVAQAIEKSSPEAEIHFVGIGSAIEKKLLGPLDYQHHELPFVPVVGGGALGLIRFFCHLPLALWRGVQLCKGIKPDVVLCFGGYPSFIPMLSACLLGLPRALHEQNVQVGLANKFLSLFSQRIFAARGAQGFWSKRPVRHLGNPVREKLSAVESWSPAEDGSPWNIFVMGGSQGAVSLNMAVTEVIKKLDDLNINVVHQTGTKDLERVQKLYQEQEITCVEARAFIDDIAQTYSNSHLIVCRAGAMTAAEVSAVGRPAIYVPLAISGGHQKQNVMPLVEVNAAVIEEHGENLPQRLEERIREFLAEPAKLSAMAEAARDSAREGEKTSAEVIATEVLELRK